MARKPSLTQKQWDWVNDFLAKHPGAKVTDCRKHESVSTRSVTIEWRTDIQVPLLLGCTDRGRAWGHCILKIKLRASGTVLGVDRNEVIINYPRCILGLPEDEGQMSLPFDVYLAEPPKAKVKAAKSFQRNDQPKQPDCQIQRPKPEQLKLPLSGISRLYAIALKQGESPQSFQEIVESEINGDRTQLPRPITLLLEDKQATEDEKSDVLRMYQIAGADAALNLVQGLDALRKIKQLQLSRMGQSET